MSSNTKTLLSFFVVAAFALCGFSLIAASWSQRLRETQPNRAALASSSPTPGRVFINPQVSKIASSISVTNRDSFPYLDLYLVINPDWKGQGFRVDVGALAPGKTATVRLADFTDGDNNRFDPLAKRLREVSVRTHVGGQLASQRIGF